MDGSLVNIFNVRSSRGIEAFIAGCRSSVDVGVDLIEAESLVVDISMECNDAVTGTWLNRSAAYPLARQLVFMVCNDKLYLHDAHQKFVRLIVIIS
jgi:hypothetical protein